MIYAMSDIHGCVEDLKKQMEHIDLGEDNRLYRYPAGDSPDKSGLCDRSEIRGGFGGTLFLPM